MLATIVLGLGERLDLCAGAKTILDSSRLVMETSGLAGRLARKYWRAVWGCSVTGQVFDGLIDLALGPVGNLQKKARDQIRGIVVGPGEDV